MRLPADSIAEWEDLISTVAQDQVPIGCIKKIMFTLKGSKRKTINLTTLRRQGLEIEEIEAVVARSMVDLSTEIKNMDLIIDVNRVAEYIQPVTDKILEKL